jgi:tripartite ATP-independent transporter DctP family solute receptor
MTARFRFDYRSRIGRRSILRGMGIACATAVLGFATPASAQDITLRFASLYPPTHAASRTADKLAELVSAKTGGKVAIDVFHNAALGSEREAAEGVKSGSIDIAYSGLPGFGSYVPEFGVLELPFNYNSLDDVKNVVDKISQSLESRMASQGLQLLGYLYDGPRVTISTSPLNSLADFDGLKLRVPQAPLYVQMAEAFGASPTPVALPEVYTALQSKIVEALEGTPTSLYSSKYYEVAKNIARTDHIFFVAYVAMNKPLFDSLPAEQQAALSEAGREASAFNLEIAKAAVGEDFARLKEAGVAFTEPNKDEFRQAVAPMKEKFAAELGEAAVAIYEEIRAVTGN